MIVRFSDLCSCLWKTQCTQSQAEAVSQILKLENVTGMSQSKLGSAISCGIHKGRVQSGSSISSGEEMDCAVKQCNDETFPAVMRELIIYSHTEKNAIF